MPGLAFDIPAARDRLGVSRRVSAAPITGTVRGIWFKMAWDYVQRMGSTEAMTLRAAIPKRSRTIFLTYPLREYLELLAVSGAIVDHDNPAEGIRRIWHDAASMGTATPLGRSLVKLLLPDPLRGLRWLVDHRDHFANYGEWRLVEHSASYVTMEMRDEYIWIESAQRGGAEGFLSACGLTGTVEAECFDDYNGRLHIRWEPRRYVD